MALGRQVRDHGNTTNPWVSILHVDDDPRACAALRRAVRHRPYRLTTVLDPEQAWERLQRETFDVVLLDINMPRLNGLRLLERIHGRFPDLPVIMVTGLESNQALYRSVELGCAGFVEKTNLRDYVVSYIDHIVSKHRRDRVADARTKDEHPNSRARAQNQ